MYLSRLGAIGIAVTFALAGCGGGGGSTVPALPVAPTPSANNGGTTQSFNPSTVKITEIAVPPQAPICSGGRCESGPLNPNVIDVSSDGSVYFGAKSPYGGVPASYGLIRYAGGSFTETMPFGSASDVEVGGVDAIDAHDQPTVIWSSAEWHLPSALPQGDNMECGGSGGTASDCPYGGAAPGVLGSYDYSIEVATDGRVWVGGSAQPGGNATASQAQLPNVPSVLYAFSIDFAKGPNAHIWGLLEGLASNHVPILFEFSASCAVLNSYPLPAGSQISGDHALIEGADGALWFADSGKNAIGRMTAGGQLHEYTIPTANSGVMNIALASDGGMWFTEAAANKVGRIDTTGHISEFNVPTPNAGVQAIAAPPSQSSCNPSQIWFTESNANKIASITY